MPVWTMASERAAIGGPGLVTRIASSAAAFQPATIPASVVPGRHVPLPPQAASAPPSATPVPSLKKALRFMPCSEEV